MHTVKPLIVDHSRVLPKSIYRISKVRKINTDVKLGCIKKVVDLVRVSMCRGGRYVSNNYFIIIGIYCYAVVCPEVWCHPPEGRTAWGVYLAPGTVVIMTTY